jgi:DNA-binding CsgD family transcriptional regulator
MSRQYPTKKCLVRIADAVEKWAKTVRSNWRLPDATAAENPAQLLGPWGVDTVETRKQFARQLSEFVRATNALGRLVVEIEPADPMAGMADEWQQVLPPNPATHETVCGWPNDVSRAVSVLKEIPGLVHNAIFGPVAPWQRDKLSVEDVQRVEWAANVLRDAAGGKSTAARRGGRKRKSSVDPELTAKQLEASQIVAECKGDIAEAARRLGKDRATVEQHYNAAMEKLGKAVVKHTTKQLPSDRRGQATIADGQDRR